MRLRSLTVLACAALLLAVVTVLAVAMPMTTVAAQPDSPGKGLAKGHAKGVVIVGYEPGTSKVKRGQAAVSVDATDVTAISPLAPNTVVMKLPPGQSVEKAIEKLEKQSGVKYAEPDYYVTTAETSNDTHYLNGSLWGMQGDASTPANQFGSGAAEAWAAGAIGSGSVYVGIIDEGVQIDHPDLAANIWTNSFEIAGNGIDDDGNGYVDDIHGWDFNGGDASVYDGPGDDHGTHVAGTIGAKGGNGFGVAGVDWKVTLVPVKFLGPSGGTITAAIAAIDYVTDLKVRHGLNIVATNNSWGYLHTPDMGAPSQALADAINRGGDRGILFVAAAGNDGKSTKTSDSTPSYLPAGYNCVTRADDTARGWDCIISVANINSAGGLAATSNYGSAAVDLGAPGSGIRSTYPSGTYADMSGTSMASPHVAGAVALCASLDSSLTAADLRSRVLSTGAATASLAGKTVTGDRLDVGELVKQCGVSVPNIVDKLEATALTDLTGAGLVAGVRSEAHHATIAAGRVISSTPAAGTLVAPDSAVAYVVSTGVAPVSVPNIVDKLEATALTDLTGAGLVAGVRSEAHHATIAAGRVISSTPAAGTLVAPNSAVAYVVSTGPQPEASTATPSPLAVPDPTPAPTPTQPPAQATPSPLSQPAAVTVVVDDLSPQFVKRAGGWRESSSGYLRHNYWVPARAGKATRIATWRPALTAPGDYRIAVRIPSKDATTQKAVYRIKTVDGWVKHRLDQSVAQGTWVDVGTYRLTTTPAVKLTDRTGERAALGRRLGFDAIRFVPAGQPQVSSDPASSVDQPPADPLSQAGPVASTAQPAADPTPDPTKEPAPDPTPEPTTEPTPDRTKDPTPEPTKEPTPEPTVAPAREPEATPERTPDPTAEPTAAPSPEPIAQPAAEPSAEPDPSPATG